MNNPFAIPLITLASKYEMVWMALSSCNNICSIFKRIRFFLNEINSILKQKRILVRTL